MTVLQKWLNVLGDLYIATGMITGLVLMVPGVYYVCFGLFMLCGGYPDINFSFHIGWFLNAWLVILIGYFFCFTVWSFTAMMFSIGSCLNNHRNYKLCIVLACILCILPPHGTLLGMATLITLSRKTSKALFENQKNEVI